MKVRKLAALWLAVIMVLGVVPGISASAAEVDIDENLILHYSFDADAENPDIIIDDSDSGLNGQVFNTVETVQGSPWESAQTVSNVLTIEGGVARFPGGSSTTSGGWGPWGGGQTQYHAGAAIKIPWEMTEKIDGDYTVSMWVKSDTDYAYASGPQRFFDFGVGVRDSIFLRFIDPGDDFGYGNLRLQDRGIASGADDSNSLMNLAVPNFVGRWNLITVTYNKSNAEASVYINGESTMMHSTGKFTRSISDLGRLSNTNYGLFLGRTQWYNDSGERANNPDFGGWMDDVRVYSSTLSPAQVQALYNETYHAPDMKVITSGTRINLTTKPGVAPKLPSTANVSFDDNTSGTVSVEWDEVTPDMYASFGRFTVRGTAALRSGTETVNYGKIMSATVTVSSGGELNDGLELYYSFENDGSQPSSITDDSGNNRTGQVLNNEDRRNRRVLSVVDVSGGKAASFPGGTWMGNGAAVKIPESARANITGDYTVSMWVRADSGYSFAGNLQRFFDFGVDQYDSIFVRYRASDGDLRFQDRGIGGGSDDQSSYMSVTNKSFVDQWGLLTLVYKADDNTAHMYVNGEEVVSKGGFTRSLGDIPGLSDDTYGMYLGRTMWQNGDNPDFCGLMDEVRLYSRAITEDEIRELYITTCPEPMVEISITHQLEDGTVIETLPSVTVAENASYSYPAPATVEYNGVTYSLSRKLSDLSISQVTSANNKITAVYVIKTVESIENIEVEVYINTKPQLPAAARLTYNTGETESVSVSWLGVPENGYSQPGTYTIHGSAAGENITAAVTVYKIDSVNVAENVYVDYGTVPQLPQAAQVTTSHGKTLSAEIIWDEIPADKAQSGEEFDLSGHLRDYPDVSVKTHVSFVLRSVVKSVAVADTYISTENYGRNYGAERGLKITSRTGSNGSGAANDREALIRFENQAPESIMEAKLKIFLKEIDNGAPITYTLYSLDPDYDWDEYTVTWYDRDSIIEAAVPVSSAYYAPLDNPDYPYTWLEFDITDYINNNRGEQWFNFYIVSSTCATYAASREESEYAPKIEYSSEGKLVSVNYVDRSGRLLLSETIMVPVSGRYTLDARQALLVDGTLYTYSSGAEIPEMSEVEDIIVITMTPADYESLEAVSGVSTYVGEAAPLPKSLTLTYSGGEIKVPVEFDRLVFDEAGTYTVTGDAGGISVEAIVKAYEPYINASGHVTGYASVIEHEYVTQGGKAAADSVRKLVRINTSYTVGDDMLNYYPQLKNTASLTEAFIATEPVHNATIQAEVIDGVSGRAQAVLREGDDSGYEITVNAVAANTGDSAHSAKLIIVRYSDKGVLSQVSTSAAALPSNMMGREVIDATVNYDREADEDLRFYLWDGTNLRPLIEPILAADLEVIHEYSHEIKELIPEYETVAENVARANGFRQSYWGPTDRVNGIDIAFWDTAAYHTGNMEAYFTFGSDGGTRITQSGNEVNINYLDYALAWANRNSWKGNNYSGPAENWTWGYNQDQGSNAVLFGDWQICFQTYLDLGLVAPDSSDLSRVREVMDYQISKSNDDFWWWADALYMVPPVMTKLYLTTGNEGYLDALYKYYRMAAELMYDGDLGIPNEGEEYTTGAAARKNSGSYLSDPDNYANLFYRDAGYVYPLNPNPGHAGEKNFWARGNGWVFAGLAKILADMPTDYEHRDFFETIYNEMAVAIIDCQRFDDQGRGFWTQSMLQNYPVGNNGNDWGYETSGTAFFTYGLFWGLNSGMLDEDTYLEPALRAWKYLSEVALFDSETQNVPGHYVPYYEHGKVGYCQPIGSNATQATGYGTDQPFGYGAFLLAGCEVSRWVGGVTENNDAYLMRKLWNSMAFSDGSYYSGGEVGYFSASPFTEGNALYVPLAETASLLGYSTSLAGEDYELDNGCDVRMLSAENVIVVGGLAYAEVNALARSMGKYAVSYDDVTVISHHDSVFYDCDENAVLYLNSLLTE